jgi:hypothetical protein
MKVASAVRMTRRPPCATCSGALVVDSTAQSLRVARAAGLGCGQGRPVLGCEGSEPHLAVASQSS